MSFLMNGALKSGKNGGALRLLMSFHYQLEIK